ncbi:unnamed protein product [Mytilus edulis]|uniref:Uncharacterized protein n=1 Tax=Mytilus edulis TaxID=6550 RepID=A0A8S3QW05_MYTED|nr:unnamed protein product [Mytilus edulis]
MLLAIAPRKHGNCNRRPKNAFSFEEISNIVQYLKNYARLHGLPQAAPPNRHDSEPQMLLPSCESKQSVFDTYISACQADGTRSVHLTTFKNVWSSCCPHIRFARFQAICDKQILERRSKDDKLDSRGRDLLDLCISNQIRILIGRVLGDTFGGLTCYTPNGASTVDYVLVSESILNQILYMRICNFIPTLSDCHCLLEWSLSAKYCLKTDCDSVKTHEMLPGFIWSDDSPALFQDALFTAEIQQRLDKFLKLEPIDSQNAIDNASLELTDIIITAANISLKRRKAQTGHYYKLQRVYTKARKHKYREYKQSLLKQIETLHEENPKQYWQLIDELQGKEKDDKSALVAPFDWLNHFKNLTEPKDEFKERLQFLEEKLNILEKRKCFNKLDSRISETEISTALSSLKVNKAAGLDNISNSMLKYGQTSL